MNPDLSALYQAFVQFGGSIFGKKVLAWKLAQYGIQMRYKVNAPQALTKLSAKGGPKPYASADEPNGNGVKYTDRILTAHQSKWDWDFDPEEFRNTYLATDDTSAYYQAALEQVAKEYLAQVQTQTLGFGVRNVNGTTAADLADGWLTILASLITAGKITPIATGAITAANAVTQVEKVAENVPAWMRDEGFRVHVSYNVFDNYKKHYRVLNGYKFNPDENGEYKLDGINATLCACPWMVNSQRIIATVDNNLVFGTDVDRVQLAPSVRRNIIEVRQMMPVGCEIQDLEAIFVNELV